MKAKEIQSVVCYRNDGTGKMNLQSVIKREGANVVRHTKEGCEIIAQAASAAQFFRVAYSLE